jgi:23S rRNA (cytidine1920-2'-O)/16S rRNA (cytidine1409-2'-O)-methyltransferase
LDAELVRREMVTSRVEAQEAIAAGLVTVDGAPALKPATQVTTAQDLVVSAPPRRFVSRGGEKLVHALEAFALDVTGVRCLDAGVSTGGFTDCLLQRGADSVLAYDVGYGQVHDRIRTDPRVEVHERTNVRDLEPADLTPPMPQLLVADLSFIALGTVLPGLLTLVTEQAVVLVKPQFEARRHEVGKGGVVRDPEVWRRCLQQVADIVPPLGWRAADAIASPLLGPAGNVEFLMHLTIAPDPAAADAASTARLDRAVEQGVALRRGARA